jgi:hypothetical protein
LGKRTWFCIGNPGHFSGAIARKTPFQYAGRQSETQYRLGRPKKSEDSGQQKPLGVIRARPDAAHSAGVAPRLPCPLCGKLASCIFHLANLPLGIVGTTRVLPSMQRRRTKNGPVFGARVADGEQVSDPVLAIRSGSSMPTAIVSKTGVSDRTLPLRR